MTSPAILATSPQTVTRRRFAAYSRDAAGYQVRGASTDTSIVAVVAPASPRQQQLLPDGLRSRQAVSVIASDELRVVDAAAGLPADVVIRDGVSYTVHVVDEWPALGPLPRSWRAVAVRDGEISPRSA